MNKIKNKIILMILIILGIVLLGIKNIYAANSISISASKTTATVGDNITVTVNVAAGAWELTLSGDGIDSQKSTGYTSDGINNGTGTITKTFTVTEAKTYTLTVSGNATDVSTNEEEAINKSVQIVVSNSTSSDNNSNTDSSTGGSSSESSTGSSSSSGTTTTTTTKSSDANIYSLSISGYSYTPTFSKDTTTYYVTVDSDVTKLSLSYNEATDASYSTVGNSNFVEGTNKVQLIITAEDGVTTKTYTIWVTRKVAEDDGSDVTGNIPDEEEDADEDASNEENSDDEENQDSGFGLEKLIITGLELNPEFQTNVYEYTIDITSDIETLDILATANEEDAIIEIFGADNLVEGENIITIIITSEDGSEIKTYQITVNKTSNIEEEEENVNNDLIYYIIAGVILIIIVSIIIGMIVKKQRSRTIFDKKEDNDDFAIKDDKNKGKRFK